MNWEKFVLWKSTLAGRFDKFIYREFRKKSFRGANQLCRVIGRNPGNGSFNDSDHGIRLKGQQES